MGYVLRYRAWLASESNGSYIRIVSFSKGPKYGRRADDGVDLRYISRVGLGDAAKLEDDHSI